MTKNLKVLFLCLAMFMVSKTYATQWLPFKEIGIELLVPGNMEHKTQTINSAVGPLNLDMYLYEPAEANKDENVVYLVTYIAYPDSLVNSDKKETVAGIFRGAIDGGAKNMKGIIISEKEISYAGFPGREANIGFQDGQYIMTFHAYLIKNKMYILQVASDAKKLMNPSAKKFFDSFKLVK